MKGKTLMAFRGDRDKWLDFTARLRKERKQVWQVLEPFIDSYLAGRKQ